MSKWIPDLYLKYENERTVTRVRFDFENPYRESGQHC